MTIYYVSSHGDKVTHFTYEVDKIYRIACMPGLTNFGKTIDHPVFANSNDPRAVTCPGCKKTEVYNEIVRIANARKKI